MRKHMFCHVHCCQIAPVATTALLVTCPWEISAYVWQGRGKRMFLAALLYPPSWKRPSCLSIPQQINKSWYIQTIDCKIAVKKGYRDMHDMDPHTFEQKKPDLKCTCLQFHFYEAQEQAKLICKWSGCKWRLPLESDQRGRRETTGVHNILCLDLDADNKRAPICKHSSSCILNLWTLF